LSVSVGVSTQDVKSWLDGLDRVVLQKALEWARECYAIILEKIDAALAQHRGRDLHIEHRRGVWHRTCLGLVRVTRRVYRDKDGRRWCLLDDLMGMRRYQHATRSVRELVLEMASTMPFRRSAEVLRKASAIDVPHQTVWRLVARTADAYLEKAEGELQRFLETGEVPEGEGKKLALLLVEADGVMLSLQRERERQAEVKVGIAYEGWERVSADRHRTVDKKSFAAVGSGDAFWAGMSLKLQETYDLGAMKDTIVGGDGASWIKDGAEYLNGEFQLDGYHLHRELCTALGRDTESKRKVWHAIQRGEIEGALGILAEAKSRARGKEADRIAHAYRYLQENRSGLEDYRRRLGDEGKGLRRTGAIEGNVDKLVVRRMKNQGMSWSLKGIQRLLCVRLLVLEGKLGDWLRNRETQGARVPVPRRKLRSIVNQTLQQDPSDCLRAELPALHGPHASRPWAEVLRAVAEVQPL